MDAPDASPLLARLRPYARADARTAYAQLAGTLLPLAGLWAAALHLSRDAPLAALALALPAAAMLMRVFILAHDCGHGALFPDRARNDRWGSLLGLLSLVPYRYWQRTHNAHHAASGDLDRRGLGDVPTLTVREYLASSPSARLGYRLVRSPLVLFGLGPIAAFWIKNRLPWDLPLGARREWASVLRDDAILAALALALGDAVGPGRALLALGPTWVLAHAAGIWLFYVQHQFEEAYWRRGDAWSFADAALRGSSFMLLPRPLMWITGSIGYHHIHHLQSRIPNYRLAEAHAAVAEHIAPVRIGLREGFAALRLKLWDEDAGRMVGWPDARRAPSTPSDPA